MKKTKLMRAALLLLVLTLITSCFVGGTFAKYTTSAEGSDTARVAKWGFKQTTIELGDLFRTTYDNVLGADDVIAPGTSNSVKFGFTYDGATTAPEVAYTFEVSTTGSSCDDSIKKNTNIKWSLDDKLAPAVGTEGDANYAAAGSWEALLAAIEALDGNKTYAAGELPAAFYAATDDKMHTVSWAWDFSTDAAADKFDTDMGNADKLATVKLVITVSATQVD